MQKDIYRNWRDLIRPKRLVVDKESLTPTYGKFFAEPLERGFGITIGNSTNASTERPTRCSDRASHQASGVAVTSTMARLITGSTQFQP